MEKDNKFSIPEPPTEFGSGFLAEFWQRKAPLPTISGMALPIYYLKRGVQSILALPSTNLVTVITIAVSFFVLSGFIILLKNIDSSLSTFSTELTISVYLKPDASNDDIQSFLAELKSAAWIKSMAYVSKEQALADFRRDLGDTGYFLEGLERDNPLPASVDIELFPDELGIGSVESSIARLRAMTVVDNVIYGKEWLKNIAQVVKTSRFVGYVALSVVLVLVIFFVSNTIKLVIYSRRDEIEIMKLVGATNELIQIPFVIGGVLQGLIGMLFGVFFIALIFWVMRFQIQTSALLSTIFPSLAFLSPFNLLLLFVLSILIGGMGSFFAVRRFTNQFE